MVARGGDSRRRTLQLKINLAETEGAACVKLFFGWTSSLQAMWPLRAFRAECRPAPQGPASGREDDDDSVVCGGDLSNGQGMGDEGPATLDFFAECPVQ